MKRKHDGEGILKAEVDALHPGARGSGEEGQVFAGFWQAERAQLLMGNGGERLPGPAVHVARLLRGNYFSIIWKTLHWLL